MKAREGLTDRAQTRFDEFLSNVEHVHPFAVHCFDEASVVMTTGNRNRGFALKGQKASEVQKYASNATYTVNLLMSPLGTDYFNIVNGPSNGLHLLIFFVDALQQTDIHGHRKLTAGDIVVMDNCKFHH